jgi:hypothetical protein
LVGQDFHLSNSGNAETCVLVILGPFGRIRLERQRED